MRKQVRYTGRVQGVGFRATAYGVARRFPVTGWVRNEADGTVLMEVQGEQGAVAGVLADLAAVMSRNIRNADVATIEPVAGEEEFTINR